MGQELTALTKVEAIVLNEDLPVVRRLFEEAGARGFTVLGDVSGLGHGGYHAGRLWFNDVDSFVLVFTVVAPELVDPIAAGLLALFGGRPGMMLVSEVRVARSAYFSDAAQGGR